MVMVTHIVERPLPIGDGRLLATGREVDAADWANARSLGRQGYLRRVPAKAATGEDRDPNAGKGKNR